MNQYGPAAEKSVYVAMREYPLEQGQALWLGPLSVAYLAGDLKRAPWLQDGVPSPGGQETT